MIFVLMEDNNELNVPHPDVDYRGLTLEPGLGEGLLRKDLETGPVGFSLNELQGYASLWAHHHQKGG